MALCLFAMAVKACTFCFPAGACVAAGNPDFFCAALAVLVKTDTNYIYANYKTVTLDDLAEEFYLSKPYLSKYIKEKSGETFGDILKKNISLLFVRLTAIYPGMSRFMSQVLICQVVL